ncbi:MAG: hypothetical protein QOF76_1409 [Solirubrobacteraceae bacterium]|jgi:hypothetical protein|nr:hypothetical protein [Solirubrobacteraceae bacterium]
MTLLGRHGECEALDRVLVTRSRLAAASSSSAKGIGESHGNPLG